MNKERNTQTLREGPLGRLAPTAGKEESFIESIKFSAWGLAWILRGLGLLGELYAPADHGWDCWSMGAVSGPFLRAAAGEKRVGGVGRDLLKS